MNEGLKEWAVSAGLLIAGVFARVKFETAVKYTVGQIAAIILVGVALMFLLEETTLSRFNSMAIVLLYGLASPSLLRALVKAFRKSEDKAAEKISDKIDKHI